MAKAFRFGSAISFIALASLTAGCAAPQSHVGSAGFAKKPEQIGLATRALAALNENNIPVAIDYAERAVASTPTDAGFRALLGSAYFAGGRLKSAEGAYKDSLSINSDQAQVILKLALVEIGLGKNNEALSYLDAGRSVLDPADYGLAVALAGRPADAIPVLESAARAPGADSRVRQNLALALALAGDWTNARAVASQDVPADQIDARIQQWMQMAAPGQQATAVAALLGVTPVAADPGQPVKLALNKPAAEASPTQVASVAPLTAPVAPPAPLAPPVAPVLAQPLPAAPPVAVAEAADPMPFVDVPAKAVRPVPKASQAERAKARSKPAVRTASAVRQGKSSAVVQLGAYKNSKSVVSAWNAAARRYRSLLSYAPMSARFSSNSGTVYRLSIKGFGSTNEAIALCSSLRRSGGTCFVRNVAGDAPVQIASR